MREKRGAGRSSFPIPLRENADKESTDILCTLTIYKNFFKIFVFVETFLRFFPLNI